MKNMPTAQLMHLTYSRHFVNPPAKEIREKLSGSPAGSQTAGSCDGWIAGSPERLSRLRDV
jgi:hypothetical protein